MVEHFASPGDPEYEPPPPETRPPSPRIFRNREYAAQVRLDHHTKVERDAFKAQERETAHEATLQESLASWDPNNDPNVEGDPYKTIFVGRLSYEATERKLRREFEEYGPVKRVRIVHDKTTGKPRGYAFIEFEHKSDMKEAYKRGDGLKIEGRRCIVDIERGRTVPGWKPRRLGGGKGGESRKAKNPKDPRKLLEKRLLARALGEEGDDHLSRQGARSMDAEAPIDQAELFRGSNRRNRSRTRSRSRSRDRRRERIDRDADRSSRRRRPRQDDRDYRSPRESNKRARYDERYDKSQYSHYEQSRDRHERDSYARRDGGRFDDGRGHQSGYRVEYGEVAEGAIPYQPGQDQSVSWRDGAAQASYNSGYEQYAGAAAGAVAAPVPPAADDEPEEGELEAGELPAAQPLTG